MIELVLPIITVIQDRLILIIEVVRLLLHVQEVLENHDLMIFNGK